MITLQQIIELTREIESEDPIDWGMLNIDEEDALRLIAMDVYDMFSDDKVCEERETIMMVTITKLILENFVLNLKLHGKQ